jgi:hypothetical protein
LGVAALGTAGFGYGASGRNRSFSMTVFALGLATMAA